MLTIRLSRVGKKNMPMYRLVISEKARDPFGRALEILGSYNPHTKELKAEADRIKYWLSKGSKMSPTVNNLLIEKNIIEGQRVKASSSGKKKKATEAEAKKEEAPAKIKAMTEVPTETKVAEQPAKTVPEKPAEELVQAEPAPAEEKAETEAAEEPKEKEGGAKTK